jgi:hypothetical protein
MMLPLKIFTINSSPYAKMDDILYDKPRQLLRSLRKAIGLPASGDVAALNTMIQELQCKAETILGTKISSIPIVAVTPLLKPCTRKISSMLLSTLAYNYPFSTGEAYMYVKPVANMLAMVLVSAPNTRIRALANWRFIICRWKTFFQFYIPEAVSGYYIQQCNPHTGSHRWEFASTQIGI